MLVTVIGLAGAYLAMLAVLRLATGGRGNL